MRRIYLIILATMISPALTMAQQTQTGESQAAQTAQAFTLDQCIQYALENSINVKNAVIDEQISAAKVKETRGIGLPQIDASVSLQHNQKLPRFFSKYDPDQPGIFDLSGVPGIRSGDVVAMQNFFQLPSSGNAGLNINQILFNSSYLVGLKAANTYRSLSERTTEMTKEEVVQQVTKAYYAVLINKDRMQLFDNNIARVESLLKTTEAMNANGFTESIDVDRIKVTLNNLRSERDKFYNLQELSVQLLKFQMNYPMAENLGVSGDISSLQVDENVLNNYALDWNYQQRTDYQLLEVNRRLLELDIKNKYSASLPSLNAFANLGYSTQSPNISGLFKTNSAIAETDQIGPDKWYSTSLFGVTLNVPLFSGLQRNYKLQQAKLSLMKVENQYTSLKAAIDLEVKQAATNYINAIKSLKSQDENKKLADNIARVTKIKYEQGVGSNIEVIDAESSLKEAQINYYSALYDALVAKVDLDKAYGKLKPQTSAENK
jgi:outer membrane protein